MSARTSIWLRLRVVSAAVVMTATGVIVQAAPSLPIARPAALAPQTAQALGCATNPTFTGHLTASSASTTAVSRITNPVVSGYISNVDTAWSCTAAYRYDGLAWNTNPTQGTFKWGTLVLSNSSACNWVVNSTDYLKGNNTTSCPTSDADKAMAITLDTQQVYQRDYAHDDIGDFSFVHSDCTSNYGNPANDPGHNFDPLNSANRPGTNCDPITIDSMGPTNQIVTYDSIAPAIAFDLPALGGPAVVTSAFYTVQFDATDAVSGFGGANGWTLQRQLATWSGSACGTFASDGTALTGTTNAPNQLSGQSLALGKCYQWILDATDQNGNSPTAIPSGSIRTDTSGVLGLQNQFATEDWDLGGGDSLAVSTGSGNVVIGHSFVGLPIRGGSLDVSATYNSQDLTNVGVGPGWRLNVQRRLALNADSTVTLTDADGSRHTFGNPVVNGSITTYTRPATLYGTLVKDTNQTAHEFTLTDRDQSKDRFDISGSIGRLETSEDRFGNAVTYTYYAATDNLYRATDPAGRYVEFTWDTGVSPNRVTSFTDWAYVSGGVVQSTATGARRLYRLFYDGSGILTGWADPLNTSGSCPTTESHLTCLGYTAGLLGSIAKVQTVATISGSPAILGTTTRNPITTTVAYSGADVTTVKDAQEVANATTGTMFSHPGPGQTKVVRQGVPATTTTYGLVSPTDSLGRVQSVWRAHSPVPIERRTTYDATYPIELALVNDNYGGSPARTVSYTYVGSSLGLVQRVTEPLDASNNRTTDYVYNANNDVTQKTVALNAGSTSTISRSCYSASTCATSDNAVQLFRTIGNYKDGVAGGTNGNAEDVTTTYQYDAFGQRIRQTRANYSATGTLLDSRAVGLTYDANGNLASQVANYTDGAVTSPSDDVTPNATTNARTDLTTAYASDTAGNRTTAADPRRAILAATGSPGPSDYLTSWTYDPLNERLSETTPTTPGFGGMQRMSSSTYDELGNVRSSVDFGGLINATEYDRTGRATQTLEDPDAGTTWPADVVSITTYDAGGRVQTAKDQRQADDSSLGYDQSSYDDLGRLQAQASAVGTTVATEADYAYDNLDRQIQITTGITDPSAQTTVTTYDLGGRSLKVDDEFTCTSRTFDYRDLEQTRTEGQPSGTCTGAGVRTVTSGYDGLGRLLASTVTAGLGLNDKPVDQAFDGAGSTLTSSSYVAATMTTVTVTSTVNPLDQVTAEVRSTGTWAKTNYDAAGNSSDRCLWASVPVDPCKPAGSAFANPQPSSVSTTSFDARNSRIALVDATANSTTTYNPDENYQISAFYLPTGGTREHQTIYGYDERHRLTSVSDKLCAVVEHPCTAGNTLLATGSDAYAYDVSDNRTEVNEANGSTSLDRFYCYDALDQLVATRSASGCSSGLIEGYTYDDSGNRMTAGSVTFTYSNSGQLASCTAGCGTVAHDATGRMQKLNGWYFEYDSAGRMIHACQSTSCAGSITKVEFAYDGSGHRTQIKEYTTGTIAKTWDFRYQGDAIVEEKLTDATHPSPGTVVRTYVVDEDGSIVKMTIPAGETGAGTYLVTWNGHGDALGLWQIDLATGALTLANSYTYTSWGQPSTAPAAGFSDLGFRFLYVGEYDVQWDNAYNLGLMYMHARHYSPALGRFLQPDPARAEGNFYAYAGNSPATHSDPGGREYLQYATWHLLVRRIFPAPGWIATYTFNFGLSIVCARLGSRVAFLTCWSVLNFVLSSSAREAREYWYAADGRAMLRYRGAAETYHGWDYSDHGQEVIYGRGGLKCAQALAGYLSPYAVGTLCGNPISLGSF